MRKTLQRATFHFLSSCFCKSFSLCTFLKINQGENCKLTMTSGKYNLIWKFQMPREQDPIGSNLQQGDEQEHLGTSLKSIMTQSY